MKHSDDALITIESITGSACCDWVGGLFHSKTLACYWFTSKSVAGSACPTWSGCQFPSKYLGLRLAFVELSSAQSPPRTMKLCRSGALAANGCCRHALVRCEGAAPTKHHALFRANWHGHRTTSTPNGETLGSLDAAKRNPGTRNLLRSLRATRLVCHINFVAASAYSGWARGQFHSKNDGGAR